jgi:hypothetical protein
LLKFCQLVKNNLNQRTGGPMLVILATWEAEIWRIKVQDKLRLKSSWDPHLNQ